MYKLMVLATACHLPGEEAYDMLQESFIDSFEKFYQSDCVERVGKGEQPLTALDSLIQFTAIELPIRCEVKSNILSVLRSQRSSIVDLFIKGEFSDMITQLASRDSILELVRAHLKHENTVQSMYRVLESSKVNAVFSDFLVLFRESCAHAYRFYGTFQNFVMNCFINFYYRGRKRDIWQMLSSTDSAKREVEMNIVHEKILEVKRTDDVLVHDHLVNISMANDMMFRHTGQSDEAYGIVYDVYYLVLCQLCRERVAEINEALGFELLEFVDGHDRKDVRLGQSTNKGIAAKITNGSELVLTVFQYVREGNLSVTSLSDLREQCFQRGKHDREGRNCIWSDIIAGGETNRYLDTVDAHTNYVKFDKLLKGVISAYTLMREFEAHGKYLVDTYDTSIFMDKDIIRYMDYMSSLDCIDLIKTLQNAPVDYSRYADDLFEFKQMLESYAGSSVNNHTHIRENRYYAITQGFLVKPRLKQNTIPTTRFDKLKSLALAMEAIPRSWGEFICTLDANSAAQASLDVRMELATNDIVSGKYNSLKFNYFFKDNELKERARYYLSHQDDQEFDFCAAATTWSLETSPFEGVYFGGAYGLYNPLRGCIFLYGQQDSGDIVVASLDEFVCFATSNTQVPFGIPYDRLHFLGKASELQKRLCAAVRFASYCGISNILQPSIQSKIHSMNTASEYVPYLDRYHNLLNASVKLQKSLADVIKVIACEVIYDCIVKDSSVTDSDLKMADLIASGFMSGEFDSESLSDILTRIHSSTVIGMPDPRGIECSLYTLDLNSLRLVFEGTLEGEDPLGIVNILRKVDGLAERFLTLFNLVYYATDYLYCLRDTLSLLLDSIPEEVSTLVCELIDRFHPLEYLLGYRDAEPKFGLKTTSQKTVDVKATIMDFKWKLASNFDSVLKEISLYTQECESGIAKLAPYSIAQQATSSSVLAEFGKAFNMLPAYTATVHLDMLRKIASYDESGFYLLGGSYFQGLDGTTAYYVHRTGRMVAAFDGKMNVVDFDLDDAKSSRLYDSIIAGGLNKSGYAT